MPIPARPFPGSTTPGVPGTTPPVGTPGGTLPGSGAGGGWWKALLKMLGIDVTPEMQAAFDSWRAPGGGWPSLPGGSVGGWRVDDGDGPGGGGADDGDGPGGTGGAGESGGWNPPTMRVGHPSLSYLASPGMRILPMESPASSRRQFGLGAGSMAGSAGNAAGSGAAGSVGSSPQAASSSPTSWLSQLLAGFGR